jgi:hypothetical protein
MDITQNTAIEDLTFSSGDTFNLVGDAVLSVASDQSAKTGLKATGTGTILLLSGGNVDFSGATLPSTITIKGGTEESPLPSYGPYLARSAAYIALATGDCKSPIVSHCVGNSSRIQAAKVVSSTSSTVTLDKDVAWEAGDYFGFVYGSSSYTKTTIIVSQYDSASMTITHAINYSIPVGATVMLLSAGFCIGSLNKRPTFSGKISGDEVCLATEVAGTGSIVYGETKIKRLACIISDSQPSVHCCFSLTLPPIRLGIFCSSGSLAGNRITGTAEQISTINNCFNIGSAWCRGSHVIYGPDKYPQYKITLRGGTFTSAIPTLCREEFVDVDLPSPLYSTLRETGEIVIRTTNPETCVIHRAGGIATLVKKGGGDTVMESAPVAEAFQLVPTGTDAVWHDQAATVEPGKKLTVAWRGYFGAGATGGGVQILADYPLFGQVAVPMGTADVLAEYSESSPTAEEWGPSRLVSWRNAGDQPVRVWVRGWGVGGTVYSSVKIVSGGSL